MVSSDDKNKMILRAVSEIQAGMTVNLGIGLPTKTLDYIEPGLPVCLHSENGITGVGPSASHEDADRNLIDAGGTYVSLQPGAAFFDSAISFSLVRSGRLDLTILGALQVSENGDLANWTIPGLFTPGPGGAIELAQKARRVVILTSHLDKRGRSKIVKKCDLPLTAPACVHRIYTDMAVLDVTKTGLVLREIAKGLSVEDVIAATDAHLQLPSTRISTF
jgi:3-oxoacid CoA-transferase subunit B